MDSRIYTIGTPPPAPSGQKVSIRTSSTELQHLFIAWIAISLAFAFMLKKLNPFGETVISYFILSLFTVGIAFLFHELAHKVVAQRYNLWAEFRMSSTMLMFAVGLAYLAGILFAAPGAVQISGVYITREQSGRIAVAGPLTNILLAVIFLSFSMKSGFIGQVGELGVLINLLLAAFNMLPFGVLDGKKVLAWNTTVFAGIFLIIIGMYMMWGILA